LFSIKTYAFTWVIYHIIKSFSREKQIYFLRVYTFSYMAVYFFIHILTFSNKHKALSKRYLTILLIEDILFFIKENLA